MQGFHISCKVKDLLKTLKAVELMQDLKFSEEAKFVSIQDEDEEIYWYNPFL